jgi:hypothetical protein
LCGSYAEREDETDGSLGRIVLQGEELAVWGRYEHRSLKPEIDGKAKDSLSPKEFIDSASTTKD